MHKRRGHIQCTDPMALNNCRYSPDTNTTTQTLRRGGVARGTVHTIVELMNANIAASVLSDSSIQGSHTNQIKLTQWPTITIEDIMNRTTLLQSLQHVFKQIINFAPDMRVFIYSVTQYCPVMEFPNHCFLVNGDWSCQAWK